MKTNTALCVIFALCFCSAGFSQSLPQIVRQLEPSLVSIISYDKNDKVLSRASGFFVSADGQIITSRHVTRPGVRMEIVVGNKSYQAEKVIAADPQAGLAKIKINLVMPGFRPLDFNTELPQIGEAVAVIGMSAFSPQIVDGLVSTVRSIPKFGRIIQMTNVLKPEMAGSPVVNMAGEVIGIASVETTPDGEFRFAIPSLRILSELMENNPVKTGTYNALLDWDSSPEGLYANGVVKLWGNKYEEALAIFEEVTARDPRYADAYLLAGYSNINLKRPKKAIDDLSIAARLAPNDAITRYNLGIAYNDDEQLDNATKAFQKALDLDAGYAEPHYGIGVIFGKRGNYVEAIAACKQALKMRPNFVPALLALGNAYVKYGKLYDALDSFEKAVALDPNLAEGYKGLGDTYTGLNDYPKAVEAYKKALHRNPDYSEAHYGLGLAYLYSDNREGALEQYKRLVTLDTKLTNELFNVLFGLTRK
jgi:tetratricopeptide (TPR) repeat protein